MPASSANQRKMRRRVIEQRHLWYSDQALRSIIGQLDNEMLDYKREEHSTAISLIVVVSVIVFCGLFLKERLDRCKTAGQILKFIRTQIGPKIFDSVKLRANA